MRLAMAVLWATVLTLAAGSSAPSLNTWHVHSLYRAALDSYASDLESHTHTLGASLQ